MKQCWEKQLLFEDLLYNQYHNDSPSLQRFHRIISFILISFWIITCPRNTVIKLHHRVWTQLFWHHSCSSSSVYHTSTEKATGSRVLFWIRVLRFSLCLRVSHAGKVCNHTGREGPSHTKESWTKFPMWVIYRNRWYGQLLGVESTGLGNWAWWARKREFKDHPPNLSLNNWRR